MILSKKNDENYEILLKDAGRLDGGAFSADYLSETELELLLILAIGSNKHRENAGKCFITGVEIGKK